MGIPTYDELYDEMRDDLQDHYDNFRESCCVPDGLSEKDCEIEFKEDVREFYREGIKNIRKATEIGELWRSIATPDPIQFLSDLKSSGMTRNLGSTKPDELRGLGIFWSWEKDKAISYWGDGEYSIILRARIDPQCHINAEDTIRSAMFNQRYEKEIRLKKKSGCNKPVIVSEIDIVGEGMEWKAFI